MRSRRRPAAVACRSRWLWRPLTALATTRWCGCDGAPRPFAGASASSEDQLSRARSARATLKATRLITVQRPIHAPHPERVDQGSNTFELTILRAATATKPAKVTKMHHVVKVEFGVILLDKSKTSSKTSSVAIEQIHANWGVLPLDEIAAKIATTAQDANIRNGVKGLQIGM
jgi:hypothetical protein